MILDLASGKYFGLDPIGTQIWQCISTPSTLATLCGRLMEEYNVSADRCAEDVSALLNELLEQGLVTMECTGQSAA